MATKIEWTDDSASPQALRLGNMKVGRQFFEHHPREDLLAHCLWALFQELIKIPCLLAAVAGATGRHDIPRRGLAALRHRHDVIPRIGWCGAIGTAPLEALEYQLLRIARNGVYTAYTAVRMLPTTRPVNWISRITLAIYCVVAGPAGSLSYLLLCQPRLTTATPRESHYCLLVALETADPISNFGGLTDASAAGSSTAIKSRDISGELVQRQPFVTTEAPLHGDDPR